jgi:hypothetical protein
MVLMSVFVHSFVSFVGHTHIPNKLTLPLVFRK